MSFGWSAGDIFLAAKLLYDIGKALGAAKGASKHYRDTAQLLQLIHLDLKNIGRVTSNYEAYKAGFDGTGEEFQGLSDDDLRDYQTALKNLKELVEELCSMMTKGEAMKEAPSQEITVLEWTKTQVSNLNWYFFEEKDVMDLTVKIRDRSQHAVSLYAVTSQAYTMELLARTRRMEPLMVNMHHLMQLNSMHAGTLLRSGPQNGVPQGVVFPSSDTSQFDKALALSHLNQFAPEVRKQNVLQRTRTLTADHIVVTAINNWVAAKIPPILWLQGKDSNTVSAIICDAALSHNAKIITFSSRSIDETGVLSHEERLFKMVYSLMYQVLNLLPKDITLFSPDLDGAFTDLQVSMDSMSQALKVLKYFLSLKSGVLCIVDGFQFLTQDANAEVETCLKEFLGFFEKPVGDSEDGHQGCKLLVTTLGFANILKDWQNEKMKKLDLSRHVDRGAMSLLATLKGRW